MANIGDYLGGQLAPLLNKTELKSDVGKAVGKIKGLSAYFTEAVDALKDNTALKALWLALPWSDGVKMWGEAIGTGLKESLPVLKFIFVVAEKLTKEPDPNLCGLLACTLAYQRAVEQAIKETTEVPEAAKEPKEKLKSLIRKHDQDERLSFTNIDLNALHQHPFLKSAEAMFGEYLEGVGYAAHQRLVLILKARRHFTSTLRLVLSHGKTQPHLDPFAKLVSMGPVKASYEVIMRHVQYQRWQFEEAPVLGEPFALKDVYIDTECGELTWGQIRDGRWASDQDSVDAFAEAHGGRKDLLATVMRHLADPEFGDAIVIQGAAGSGKSSFTLRLCAHLEKQGLYPLRIRLRDVSHTMSLHEALPRALFPKDSELPEAFQGGSGNDPFQNDLIFQESVTFIGDGSEARICPYVLILDGWDEISVSASEGFQQRVERTLGELRDRYLGAPGAHIRVIITGRPSEAVAESRFLLKTTPVLTIRPIRPDQLEEYLEKMRSALEQRPVEINLERWQAWSIPDGDHWDQVLQNYRECFKARWKSGQDGQDGHGQNAPPLASDKSLDILGLPLLAQLAVRLFSVWDRDRPPLLNQPTTLYRHLADLTCEKGGKSYLDKYDPDKGYFLSGGSLRELLRHAAAAMTVVGEEGIAFGELAARLRDENLMIRVESVEKEHILSQLVISFFFKGGHPDLGCEFLHKSFREYFFAEGIVEALKTFGRDPRKLVSERDYWQDFQQGPLWDFSRELGRLLGPKWLSAEVKTHLDALLRWEIARSFHQAKDESKGPIGQPTAPLKPGEWERVRDGLAELWQWWGEGAHLRPDFCPGETPVIKPCFAEELVRHDLPYDYDNPYRPPAPARTTTMDAHLGDALIRITAIVHYEIAVATGWLVDEEGKELTPKERWGDMGVAPSKADPRPAQRLVSRGDRSWLLFAPAGTDRRFFEWYQGRINSAGWRPQGRFPGGGVLDGVCLCGVSLILAPPLGPCSWRHANLSRITAAHGDFYLNDFSGALLVDAVLSGSDIYDCEFYGADLSGVSLNRASVEDCDLDHTDLRHVVARDARFYGTSFEGALLNMVENHRTEFIECTGLPSLDAEIHA